MSDFGRSAGLFHAQGVARLALGLVGLVALAVAHPLPASAQSPPPLDLTATEQALTTEQIYRAPGAVAVLNEQAVRPELTAETRIVLAPWVSYQQQEDNQQVTGALGDWARQRRLRIILVTGLSVRTLGSGEIAPSGLDGLRAKLAYSDVTAPIALAARNIRDGTTHADDPPTTPVGADPAEVARVVTALRASPRYVEPGVSDAYPPDAPAPTVPGLPVRVAVLPALAIGTPFPDLAPAVSAAFPGELVVVVRGRWIDAAGPGQDEVDSARNYTFGYASKSFVQWGTATYKMVGLFLQRLTELRDGAAFRRPMVKPVLAAELFDRYARGVFITLAALLGGGSLLWWGYWARRTRRAAASALRLERARAGAELATVGADLISADAAAGVDRADTRLLGEAAERHATARTLLEQARTPGAVRAARAAASQAQRLLARAVGGRS